MSTDMLCIYYLQAPISNTQMVVEAIGIFTLDDVDDRIRRNDVSKEILLSKEVNPTEFAVKIKFQRSDDHSLNWLICSITNVNRKIANTTVEIKMLDVNLKVLGQREHDKEELSGFNEQLCGMQFSLNRISFFRGANLIISY